LFFLKDKGFVLTTDAFIGVTLLALLMLTSLSFVSQIELNSWNFINLLSSTRDLSIVLEEDDVLKNAVLQNSSEALLNSINSTPSNLCFEVSVFEENNSVPVLSGVKAGCIKSFSDLIIINNSFVIRSNDIGFYFSKIEGWVK
jgi:hypothetical protein